MIDGPSQKKTSAPSSQVETPSAKRQRANAAVSLPMSQTQAEPVLPNASSPAGASSPATQLALNLPPVVVTTSHKRRYPLARPPDFDPKEERKFLVEHDQSLNQRLQTQQLTRAHLLGKKRGPLLGAVAAKHKAFIQARDAFMKQVHDKQVKAEVGGAMNSLVPALRKQVAALVRHSMASEQLMHAQHYTPEKVSFAQDNLIEAQAGVTRAEEAVAAAVPAWAAANGTAAAQALHGPLMNLAERKMAVDEQRDRVITSMRVLWLQLGEHTFTKLPHIGAGAFGKVSVAMRSDGTLRALKYLRTAPGSKPRVTQPTTRPEAEREVALMQRFYDASTRLHHDPHTAKLIIEMPLALNSLDNILKEAAAPGAGPDRPNPDAVALVRSTGRQLFAKLAEMHAANVVHNDVKPGNINVQSDGRVLAADFGMARQMPEGAQVGTPAYAAPEHSPTYHGTPRGVKTDVWSAGLSLAMAHVPFRSSPFAVTDFTEIEDLHARYADWHGQVVASGGGNLAQRLAQGPANAFSTFFLQLHHKDSQLCEFLLTKVLVPQEQRVSAQEAHLFFAGLQPPGSPPEQALGTELAKGDQTPYRRAAEVALKMRFEEEAMKEAEAL